MGALQHRIQNLAHIVVRIGFTGLAKCVVNHGLIIFIEETAGGKQSQATGIGRGDAKVVVGNGPMPAWIMGYLMPSNSVNLVLIIKHLLCF